MTAPEHDGGVGIRAALPVVAARLPDFLPNQRWFGGKERAIRRVEIRDTAVVPDHPNTVLAVVDVFTDDPDAATYFVPLGLAADAPGEIVVPVGALAVRDAIADAETCRALLRGMLDGQTLTTERGGRFVFQPADRQDAPRAATPHEAPSRDATVLSDLAVRHAGVEQSNSSVIFGTTYILKALRRLAAGVNPEIEIPRFLGQYTAFDRVPALVGWAEYVEPDGTTAPVAVLQRFVANQGDGWSYVLGRVAAPTPQPSEEAALTPQPPLPGTGDGEPPDHLPSPRTRGLGGKVNLVADIASLGRTLGDLHLALASRRDVPDFAPEPVSQRDVDAWRQRTCSSLDDVLRRVEQGRQQGTRGQNWSAEDREDGAAVLAGAARLRKTIDGIAALADGVTVKTRHHGDFHLGQTLVAPDGWIIIDFEGEPLRSLAERRAKQTPLRDLAGLIRSLDYARATAERSRPPADATHRATTGAALARTFEECRVALLAAYIDTVRAGGAPLLPADPEAFRQVLDALELEKALYELTYELGNRPDWVSIPLSALARLARAS